MYIKLRNFRCHTDAEFELPDSGLTLLSGMSGSGKSSILKGVLYAFFGTKAVRKPYSFGSTTASVTLKFMGMKIHRTSRPNRVIVNDTLEDAEAQEYINEKLGMNFDEFMISSYIPQKNNTSVLSLSQADQLRLIKTLAFEGNCNEIHKDKLKKMVSQSSTTLTEKKAHYEFCKGETDRIEAELFPIDFPFALEKGETEDQAIEKYQQRVKTFSERLSKFIEEKASDNEILQQHVFCKADLDIARQKFDEYTFSLDDKKAIKSDLLKKVGETPKDLADTAAKIELSIQYLDSVREKVALENQHSEIHGEELLLLENKRNHIEHALWIHRGDTKDHKTAEKELNSYVTRLQTWGLYNKSQAELNELNQELGHELDKPELLKMYQDLVDYNTEHLTDLYSEKERVAILAERLALEKTFLECPECSSVLKLSGNELHPVTDHQHIEEKDYSLEISDLEERIETCNSDLEEYRSIISRIESITIPNITETDPKVYVKIEESIVQIKKYIQQNIKRQDDLTRVNQMIIDLDNTPALKKLSTQITEKKELLDEILEKLDGHVPDSDIEELRSKMHSIKQDCEDLEKNKLKLAEIKGSIVNIDKQRGVLTKKIGNLEQKISNINIDAIKKKIAKAEKDITRIKKKQEEDHNRSDLVDRWLVYRRTQIEFERWTEKLEVSLKEYEIAEKTHTAHLILKEKYTQAEISALESTITSINEHTRYYLDSFFADHQLSALIKPVDKGKKIQSYKIDSVISYKGNDYDNISQLSGGEFDRCTLASICGINSMLASPILILDESLASLDADTNTEIITFLKELSQDKLILVCSHEAIQGIFDEIIKV